MNKYSKGDYIRIMTNQPELHFNEMFGHNDLKESDFRKTEYVAFIKSVIDNSTYLVMTVRPYSGFRCVIDKSDVIGLFLKSELTQEELKVKENEEFTAPNIYYPKITPVVETLEERCKYLAKEAVTALFPEEEIASLDLSDSDFLKSHIIKQIDSFLEKYCRVARQDLIDEKTAKRNMLEKMLSELRFKEYYNVMVGFYEDAEHTVTRFETIVVSTYFDEVCIIRNPVERFRFENSLGPDFDVISKTQKKLRRELMW